MLVIVDSDQTEIANNHTLKVRIPNPVNTNVSIKTISIPSHLQENGPIYLRIRNVEGVSKVLTANSNFDFFVYIPTIKTQSRNILTTQSQSSSLSTFSYIFTNKTHIENICFHFDEECIENDPKVTIKVFKNGEKVWGKCCTNFNAIHSFPFTFQGSNSIHDKLPCFESLDSLDVEVISDYPISYRAHYSIAQSDTITYNSVDLEHNLPSKMKLSSQEFYIEIFDHNFQLYDILQNNRIFLGILFE